MTSTILRSSSSMASLLLEVSKMSQILSLVKVELMTSQMGFIGQSNGLLKLLKGLEVDITVFVIF